MSGIPAPEAVLTRAASLIREAEGFSARPYRDAGGRPTIGWGSTRYADGRAVAMGDPPIGRAAADALLQAGLAQIWAFLAPHLVRAPSPGQAAALLSLAYNIGVGALAASTLLAKFNRGDIVGAAAQFPRFDKARIDGALMALPGLTARRRREQALFLAPDSPTGPDTPIGKENT
jgi:GH24 family phage-related lysozyme (muramidase)